MHAFPLLATIDSPADLRKLAEKDLPQLAQEVRDYMIQCLDHCGGHFGSNLGAVELSIALHYVFDTPNDRLVWDVGHQAYPHKILTGRRDQLRTIKQPEGLAPFPKRAESQYDHFGVGHSSTSISAALGMAVAAQLDNNERKSIAIIGDGGLTGGMAFEALNHGGALDPNLLVVLNDNEMSISENVGALTHYFARILSGKIYSTLREGGKKVLAKMPPLSRLAKKTETHLKGMVVPGTLFEELGFHYFGPIDGHDVISLVHTLQHLKNSKSAKLLHIITVKGKGYLPAEQNPIEFHAVKPGFHTKTSSATTSAKQLTYSEIFGEWLCDMAALDNRLIGITPAMCEGSGMVRFAKEYKNRYHDVGIAEQHSVTFAAGLACEGKKPVVAIYSTFLQRAYDQLIHDVALQNLDVTFALDRAGLVGSDGPTHAGSFDLSFLRCIPNMVVMAPCDSNECWQMLNSAYHYPGPAAVRYSRGTGPKVDLQRNSQSIPIGKATVLRTGKDVLICAFGSMVHPAEQAGQDINATVVNMRFIKPLDETLISELAKSHSLLVTVEENAIMGGAGSAITEFLHRENIQISVLQLGLPDNFLEHGNADKMLAECGLDAEGIKKSIQQKITHFTLEKETRRL
jgi:1-deoxy-D-xylulose-5-phosphate synthase